MAEGSEFEGAPRGLRRPRMERPAERFADELRRREAETARLLATVACERFELSQALDQARARPEEAENAWRAVEIVVDRLGDLLEAERVEVEDPTGGPWRDAMRETYDLIGFARKPGVKEARVDHAMTPLVRRLGKVIHKGQVTVETPEAPARDGRPEGNDQEESD